MTARRTLASLLFLLLTTMAGSYHVPHSTARPTNTSGYTHIYADRQPQRQTHLQTQPLAARSNQPVHWPSFTTPEATPVPIAHPRAPPIFFS